MRVVGRRRPAEHVEAGVAAQDLRKVGSLGLCNEVDLDADLRQAGRHALADLAVVHVTVVRAVHRHFEALRIASIGQQLLGCLDVERQTLVLFGVVAVDARADHQGCRTGSTSHHGALDAVDVDGLVKSLPDALVLERILSLHIGIKQLFALLVHAKEDGTQLGADDHAGGRRGVDSGNVLHRHGLHHVDFAREQRRHAGCRITDRREDHFLRIAFDLAPVVSAAGERRAHIGLALAHAVRASAVGLERGGVFDALAAVYRLGGVVSFTPFLAHDGQLRKLVRQDGVWRLGFDVDGEIVDLAHFLEIVGVALHVGAFAGCARQAEYDVVCRERRAVVKLHALAQLETPHRRAELLPARGEQWRQAQVLVATGEGFIHVLCQAQLQRLAERMRVQRQRIALVGNAHGLRGGDPTGHAQGA